MHSLLGAPCKVVPLIEDQGRKSKLNMNLGTGYMEPISEDRRSPKLNTTSAGGYMEVKVKTK